MGKKLSFGLLEMPSGDAALTLNFLTTNLDHICDKLDGEDKTVIKAVMSDLDPVSTLFNCNLKEIREKLLSTVRVWWDSLTNENKREFREMSNCF